MKNRWMVHRWELNRGRHHCRALQFAWVKHGGLGSFAFVILEECLPEQRRMIEQAYLDTGKFVYNSARKVDAPSELSRAVAAEHCRRMNKIPWTEERRKNASKSGKARPPAAPISVETRLKMKVSARRRKAREKAEGLPGPWAIKLSREPPKLCACGCGTKIRRRNIWARGHWIRGEGRASKVGSARNRRAV